jgi:hypothetical protein
MFDGKILLGSAREREREREREAFLGCINLRTYLLQSVLEPLRRRVFRTSVFPPSCCCDSGRQTANKQSTKE